MSDEPDFSEFDDWLVDGPAGKWPSPTVNVDLSAGQRKIVDNNAKLLLHPQEWNAKAARFGAELKRIVNDEARIARRNDFEIRFDKKKFNARSGVHDFRQRHFPCTVSFTKATFGKGNVYFNGATFRAGEVLFHNVTFEEGNVSFQKATFEEGNLSFFDTIFGKGDVFFIPKYLHATNVSFLDVNVSGNLFVRADFPNIASFQNLNVKGVAQFSNCTFSKIPDFRDAKFELPPEVAGMVVPPPKLDGRDGLFRVCEDEEAVAKFRKLKAMALAAHDHEMGGQFFAYELMAKRGTETKGFFPLLFNSLYGVLGGYGQSFMLPIGWLTASLLGFSVAYFFLTGSALGTLDGIRFALGYSFRHTIPLFNSLLQFAESPSGEDYNSTLQENINSINSALGDFSWFTCFAFVQQFIGLILLFLLLLALRNTFRLK